MKTLIVVDMQNDFIDGALANPAAAAIIPDMVKYIKNFAGDVICTRDTHYTDYLLTQEGKRLPIPHCICDTEGWELNGAIFEVVRDKNDFVVVNKESFGDISTICHALYRDVDEIYLCGTCTDICVVSIALNLKAHYPETKIYCLGNLCAGVTPESHEAALTVMKMCQIEVI